MSNRVDYVPSRAVISGQYVEVYDYSKPLCIGFKFPKEINKCFPKTERRSDQTEITAQNMRRTRKEITRLVNCNQHLIKFMTLTFAENKTDLPSANKLFDLFIQRLKLRYPDFEFVCAIEFQKRGAVHYHLLCNLPYIDNYQLRELWGHGYAWVRMVDNIDNLGRYVSKYMSKTCTDSRLFKKKKFHCSQTLKRPLIIDDFYKVLEIKKFLSLEVPQFCEKLFTTEIFTKFFGTITYTQYWTSKYLPVHEPPDWSLVNF